MMNSLNFPILSVITYLPLLGIVVLCLINGKRHDLLRWVAFLTAVVTFLVSLPLYFMFDSSTWQMQFVENVPWVSQFGINYHMGIDGISLLLVLLTTFLSALAILSTWSAVTEGVKGYMVSLLFLEVGMLGVFCALDFILFYVFWEVMLIPMYFIIGIWGGPRRIYAAVKFFIYTMSGSVLMLVAILVLYSMYYKATGVFTFDILSYYNLGLPSNAQFWLFLAFFLAFAIKVPMFPFHTWLPLAHPAAPAHISGIMSGVIIKIGIYGILRMIFLIRTDYLAIGYFILFISIISGIYGVMLAILQHNLKRLLAYHSIENIGIIGIGIGLGCIGLGIENNMLSILGFSGALLHTLNHSLFKSLLFYGAGNIYQSAHTVNIEQLGGLGKNMAQTAFLFLIASLAICGLPPFNGFVSEFIIYSGIFNGIHNATFLNLMFFIFSIFGLVLIGGLAIFCFTKAFGTIFLGSPRHLFHHQPQESSFAKRLPMFLIVILILTIGIFPTVFLKALSLPVSQLTGIKSIDYLPLETSISKTISQIGYVSLLFIGIVGVVFFIRKKFTISNQYRMSSTWGCGYIGQTSKMQYTASSFVRNYRKLAEPLFSVHKFKRDLKGVFPGKAWHETHPKDKIEEMFISHPIRQLKHFLNYFSILQSGKPQMYILYGAVFITLIIAVPQIYSLVISVFKFLNNL